MSAGLRLVGVPVRVVVSLLRLTSSALYAANATTLLALLTSLIGSTDTWTTVRLVWILGRGRSPGASTTLSLTSATKLRTILNTRQALVAVEVAHTLAIQRLLLAVVASCCGRRLVGARGRIIVRAVLVGIMKMRLRCVRGGGSSCSRRFVPTLLAGRGRARDGRRLVVGWDVLGVRILRIGIGIVLMGLERVEIWLLIVVGHHAKLSRLLSADTALAARLAARALLSRERAREVRRRQSGLRCVIVTKLIARLEATTLVVRVVEALNHRLLDSKT